ncbi:MAG: hypothetical protein ACRCWC_12470, partial [Plesiomonas shigelloides]
RRDGAYGGEIRQVISTKQAQKPQRKTTPERKLKRREEKHDAGISSTKRRAANAARKMSNET